MDTNEIDTTNLEKINEGTPLPVTILGVAESREVVRVGNTLALGSTTSKVVLAFPQTHKDFPPRTFIVEVPSEVVVEYAECTYDLYREAHPEMNLPDRKTITGQPLPIFKTP